MLTSPEQHLRPLWSWFRRSLHRHADRDALVTAAERWTYRDVEAGVAAATARLRAAGVDAGARVLLLTDNGPTFPIHDLAIMALGAVKVPLNSMLTATEVGVIARRTEPAAIVISESLQPLLADIDPAVARVDATVRPPTGTEPVSPWSDPPVGPADPAVVYFTGGTTGEPKGIVHSQGGVALNLLAHALESGISDADRVLLTTPLPHAAGLFVLTSLLRGATVYIEPGFDPVRVAETIEREAITWTFAVPTMIYRLLDHAEATDWCPRSLSTIQYGAAPISPDRLRQAVGRFGPVLQQLYAQTECPNYATALTKLDHVHALDQPQLLASCGRATTMCDVAVLDPDGNVIIGEIGEVALDAPYVMAGYWRDDAGERRCGRWLRTGDLGYLDDRGYLYLVDRRSDMIVSGGMNVYSVEVERVLLEHDGVGAVAVVGVPHDDWGEAVHAVVVGVDGWADAAELADHCRRQLAAYKRPKSFEFVAQLPLTRYGKIDKKAVRAPHWAGQERAIG